MRKETKKQRRQLVGVSMACKILGITKYQFKTLERWGLPISRDNRTNHRMIDINDIREWRRLVITPYQKAVGSQKTDFRRKYFDHEELELSNQRIGRNVRDDTCKKRVKEGRVQYNYMTLAD